MNSAAVNMGVQAPLQDSHQNSFGYLHGSGLLYYLLSLFFEEFQAIFHGGYAFYIPKSVEWFDFLYILISTCDLLITALQTCVRQYLIVALMFSSSSGI